MRSSLIRLQAKSRASEQYGFALAEALVATAIIAGIMAVAATGFAGSLRLAKDVESKQLHLSEARNIMARLHAGLPEDEILRGFDSWQITYEKVNDRKVTQQESMYPVTVEIRKASDASLYCTTVVLMTGLELQKRL